MATQTIKIYPSGYDTSDYSYASLSNVTNGYTASSSTTYAQINLTTGSGAKSYIYFTFDTSAIPEGAIITDVSCTAKASVDSVSSSYIAGATLRLYKGTVAEGSSTMITSTSGQEYSLTTGSWSYDDINSIRLRVYAQRGGSAPTASRSLRFYGATLTITYEVPEIVPVVGSTIIGGVRKTLASDDYTTIDGVRKPLKKSYGNIGGVWHPMWGVKRTYGMLTVGETITLNVGGTSYEWIVVQQGLPAVSGEEGSWGDAFGGYDASCNGTWLLMKNCYTSMTYGSGSGEIHYVDSPIHTYLNGTFLGNLDVDVQNAIKLVNINVSRVSASYPATGRYETLTTKVFLPSLRELGISNTAQAFYEGDCLNYFVGADATARASNTYYWVRTYGGSNYHFIINTSGGTNTSYNTDPRGVRPMIIMDSDTVYDFALGGLTTTTFTWKKYNVVQQETGKYVVSHAEDRTPIFINQAPPIYSDPLIIESPNGLIGIPVTYYGNCEADSSGQLSISRPLGDGSWSATQYFEFQGKIYMTPAGDEWDDMWHDSVHYYYLIAYETFAVKETKPVCGSYISDVTSTNATNYPTNGLHSDGYWYIKQ